MRFDGTINLKLNFEIDDFVAWYNCDRQYYDFIESRFYDSSDAISILRYEEIHAYKTNRDKFTFLYNFLTKIGLELEAKNLSISESRLSNLRVKQDKRVNILDKVNNPQETIDTLTDRQLEFLLT